jgi:hypothetical protein
MHETIVNLAAAMAGADAAESALLDALTAAAEAEWTGRLQSGVTADDCAAALTCAAAFTAAAQLLTARAGRDGVSRFTAGDVTVQTAAGGEAAKTAEAMRRSAEELMTPYACDKSFRFLGVRA